MSLVLKHFLPLLDRQGAMAALSAKVGSIGDNRLGGWYAYRSSKAALNMLLKTAAIELARPAIQAAAELLRVIDQSTARDSGSFLSGNGERLPW